MRSRLVALCLVSLLVIIPGTGPGGGAEAGGSEPRTGVVNVAVDAAATASSQTADHPALLATDGNAATAWCPGTSPGTLTIDLGHPQDISGFGISLAGGAATGTVEIALATSPHSFLTLVPSLVISTGAPTWVDRGRARTIARYVRVTLTGDPSGCIGELRVLGDSPRAPAAIGHDLSFAIQEAAIGSVYTDRGRAALPEQILADHGANFVRLRLWLDPPGGYSNLSSVLAMAQRAHAAGMQLLLDFHYSDFWADPGKQNTPAAWQQQDLATLATTVRTYTHDVLAALAAQGTPAAMVQIGNEIRTGMLWPLGWADAWSGDGWANLGTLLRAAAAGVADSPEPTPRIVIHFDQGGDNAFSRKFFDRVVEQRVPFDVIGLSYYPFWHGTITQLRTNLADLTARYQKQVMIVETQYGWTLANGDSLGNFLWQQSQVIPGYPATPDGQLAFAFDLVSALAAVPGGRGAGIFYWQPEWIPGIGWTPGEGTPNDNLTMFDFSGRALPSVQFSDPLRACREFAAGQAPCTF
ncbi:MAG TPA: glycosyl hydrolase 53 family protein [Kofleriaceae bacterium]